MLATNLISIIVFALSAALSLFALLGSLSRRVGIEHYGANLFFLFGAGIFFATAQGILQTAPPAWGAAYIGIVLTLFLILLQSFLLHGTLLFTKRAIYRLQLLLPRRYRYEQVIGYTAKNEAGTAHSRFGSRRVVSYIIRIYFGDNRISEVDTAHENTRTARYVKNALEQHKCHRNGRSRRKPAVKRQCSTK